MKIPAKGAPSLEPLPLTIRVVVYIMIAWLGIEIFGRIFPWFLGPFGGPVMANLFLAFFANFVTLRIYTSLPLADLGLWWNRASIDNLAFGLLGGASAAVLVLGPPLLTGAAHLVTSTEQATWDIVIFVTIGLAAGAAAEEILMRGYAFQILLPACGAWATIIPVGVLFGLLHSGNPGVSRFSTANTVGFGILFGYAYLRSRDIWLPIGLHFGWNIVLPLFGVNLSGLTIKMTGHDMVWSAGSLWSGGAYGPEASILTSAVMVLLAVYLWKAPIRRQHSPITDPPLEGDACEPSPVISPS